MINELKKISFKKIKKRILILGIIVLLIFIPISPCLVILAKGKVDFYSLTIDELNNAYVDADITFVYGSFANYTETENDMTRTVKRLYIIPVGEYEFMGLEVPGDDISAADTLYYETYEIINGTRTTMSRSLHYTGTVRKMSKEIEGYYRNWFIEAGFDSEDVDRYALKYILKPDYVGYLNIYYVYLAIVACSLLFLYCLVILLIGLTGINMMQVNKFIKRYSDTDNLNSIELDYYNAVTIDSVKFGQQYTIYFKGFRPKIIKNKDILWAYLKKITHRTYGIKTNVEKLLILHTYKKDTYTIKMSSEDNVYAALELYSLHNPHIVLGYTKEIKRVYKKDLDTLLDMGRKQAAKATQQDFESTTDITENVVNDI